MFSMRKAIVLILVWGSTVFLFSQTPAPGTVSQSLGPITAVAGSGATALQCVFTNNAGTVAIACTVAGAPVFNGTLSPVVAPSGVTGLLETIQGNGNTVTWIFTPGAAAPGQYNWSITANTSSAKGTI